jgi:D-sedoheptulose 7-phosphate isomerase
MQLDIYKHYFETWFADAAIRSGIAQAVDLLRPVRRMLFIGNGGSNSICSHMMEDYMKMARKQTLSFTDAALITCFANDYGYEQAQAEWVRLNHQPGDVLVAISSSGESQNIINAVTMHQSMGGTVITLSGFATGNRLSTMGAVNFHTPLHNYGVVEAFHLVILHAILDELVA